MGSGGNVGRAIYARDLSRDKSRGEYVCEHTFPAERTHALARGGITRRRRNRIYVRVARLASTDHPFFSFTPPPPPPPRSRGWSRRFPREQSFDPAYLLAASSIFPSQFVHVSAGTRVQFTPFSETRPKTRTCRVSGLGREFIRHSLRGICYMRVNETTREKDGRD